MARRGGHLEVVDDEVEGPGGGNGNGGNGNLTRHRLTELERRMRALEGRFDQLNQMCTRIDEQLKNTATKSDLWKFVGGTGVLMVLTLVGHILLRIVSGSG